MNVYDLYEAIGSAEEAYLLHSERRVGKTWRRATRLCMVLGILVTALLTTAAASPSVRRWLFGVGRLQTVRMGERISIVRADTIYERSSYLAVTPEAELREDYPEKLESFYVPMHLAGHWIAGDPNAAARDEPELFRRVESLRMSENLEIQLVFEEPDSVTELGNPVRLQYRQYAAPLLERGEPLLLLELPPDNSYGDYGQTIAGFGVRLIVIPPWKSTLRASEGQYWYFWSDGSYVYSIGLNRKPEQELIENIISSLAPVKSIRKYINPELDGPPPVALTRNLTPAWVPEGYAWREDDELYNFKGGYASFFWFGPTEETGGPGYFRLTLNTDPEAPRVQREFWAAEAFPEYRDYTVTECTVRGCPAVLYESKLAAALIWQEADGLTVELHSEYERRLSGAQLLRIAESLEDAPLPMYQEETP